MVYVDVKEKRSKEGQSRYGVERSPNHGSQETGGWGEEERIKTLKRAKLDCNYHRDFDRCPKVWRIRL